MTEESVLPKLDMNVLLRIVMSRKGASFQEIVAHECSHHRQHPPAERELRESLARLEEKQLIEGDDAHFQPHLELQQAFLNECRNCRDTFEEHDVLQRILANFCESGAFGRSNG